MGTFENRIANKQDRLQWATAFTAAVASRFNIPGASPASLNRAFKNLQELSTHETALPLDKLLSRFITMAEKFQPFTIKLDDPEKAKTLLEEFESGQLLVSVSRGAPLGALVYSVFLVEFHDGSLFAGLQDGAVRKVRFPDSALSIEDDQTAVAAVGKLQQMGHPCRVTTGRARIERSQLAKSLQEMGFTTEQNENAAIGGTDGTNNQAS